MLKSLFAILAAVLVAVAGGRSDPHVQPHRPTPVPTATLTATPSETAFPPPVEHVHPPASATPYPTIYLCQVCIDVSGTPQWPNPCIATQFVGGSCAPTETHTPNPYP